MEITSDKSEQGQIEMPGKISLWVTVSPLAKFQLSSLFSVLNTEQKVEKRLCWAKMFSLASLQTKLSTVCIENQKHTCFIHNKCPAHKSVYVQHHVPLPQLRKTQDTHVHIATELEKVYSLVFPCINNAVSQT